ncbi:MAG: hypothetical protein KDK70_22320 [Myxococcales bacterium]|nr:hypothetical protein [Myxococcales bacterium]
MASVGDNAVSSADVSRLLDAFEEALEDLRISYEKYFLGVDRQAPATKHGKVKAQLRRIEELRPRSTALRFRFAGLKARLVTYQHYWNRILSQIEKGTFRRDLQQRTQRRRDEEQLRAPTADALPPPPEAEAEAEAEAPVAALTTELSAPRPAASGVRPPPPPPPPPPVPGMKGGELQRLFQELVRAKQAAGEDTQGLTVRALARKLSRELPKLQQRHGGQVRFEVATVGGKVRLRARSTSDPA